MKNNKKFDREPRFSVGDRIKHPKHGEGVIRKVRDETDLDYDFFYDVDFTGRKGDGTKAWLPKNYTEKKCEKIN